MQEYRLSEDWRVQEHDPALDPLQEGSSAQGWIVATVPGSIHEALLAAGRIPDPFYGLNESAVQWVGERDWLYRCDFTLDEAFLNAGPPTLCFDGLDTIATVWLNGKQVHASENMFVSWRLAVDGLLRAGSNTLLVLFASALRYGQEQEARYGRRAAWNGDPSRVYVRKAQYHYGWDWGPCLLTAGPWREVRLEAGAARIADLHCPVSMAADLSSAVLPVQVTVEAPGAGTGAYVLHVAVVDPSGVTVEQADVSVPADGRVQREFRLEQPELWWPNGYGAQPLYTLQAVLRHGDTAVDRRDLRVGARRLRLVQEPIEDEPGTSFLFEINNAPIFCGGANWIPADSLATRLTAADYRLQLQQAADAHLVMLRIWGGGIYEADVFYDLCDELGLMVWQDFMFACGMYPAHQEFQHTVRAEAETQVRRLRHHPSIVLWCGNNEDYAIAESQHAYDRHEAGDLTVTSFPARAIYEHLLPEVCALLDPTRPYWPGSPYGGAASSDQTVGDRHTWDIWHGMMAPYHAYPRFEGRFVSEFGMESCPSPAVIDAAIPPEERYPQSRSMDHHNKSTDGPRRLAAYLNDTLRVGDTLPEYIYATQFVQAEALSAAYRGWRRRWQGPGRYAVAGALVWQLDDCWPVTSWAVVDYARHPKPAYYIIRRALAPLTVELAESEAGVAVWAVNGSTEHVDATLELTGFTLDGVQVLNEARPAALAPNRAVELGIVSHSQQGPVVAAARLRVNGTVQARTTLWPEPFKYLALPDPQIAIEVLKGDRVQIQAARPAKGVWLTAPHDVRWSDNMLDLIPGDPQIIIATGLGAARVRAEWLGSAHT